MGDQLYQGSTAEGEWPDDNVTGKPRTFMARAGIALLNILVPGLGLLRLGHLKAGLFFLIAQAVIMPLLSLAYALLPELNLSLFRWLTGTAILVALLLYCGAIFLSWRRSAGAPPDSASTPWWSRWYGLTIVTIVTLGAAYPLTDWREQYYRNFFTPADSMAPALLAGDRIIADMRGHAPVKRGDIVLVKTQHGTVYIKRVVALPGDRIEGRQGQIILNGKPVFQTPVVANPAAAITQQPRAFREQFPGEAVPHIIWDYEPTPYDNWPLVTMGAKQYFLMGDNRDRSADSRVPPDFEGLGSVTEEQISGKLAFIWWHRHQEKADHGTIMQRVAAAAP